MNQLFKGLARSLTGLAIAVLFILLVRMPLSWTDQAIFSGLIIVSCIVLGRFSESRLVTSMLTFVSIYCSVRYAIWRWTSSVSYLNHSGWQVEWIGLFFALALLCAETYSVLILLLGYFQSSRPLRRKPVPMPADIASWPTVDIFIPTYNEPLDVVRPTVLAAMEIDWPQQSVNVYILDDGRRPEFREFAEECGCHYLIRSNNAHAKAGNINAALKETKGEYIAIFDCDHIATRSFLQLTMGLFTQDERLALVQTPHHFYSPDPFERNLNLFRKIPNEGSLFYGVVQDGNDLWNATFFCGSCAVIKRSALEQIGGIAVETVTEDAHTALRLQRLGWNTAYIGIPQAAGLATGSLAAHVGQRIRWARGMVQILRTECPLFATGLNFAQRICYLNCVLHYLYAIPRLIFVSAPLVYLILGRSNLYGMIWEILAYAAPHLVLSNMVNSRCQGDHRHSFWNEVYEMVLAPYILLPTTFALINPKWGKFNVTAKSNVVDESYFDWQIAKPYLFLLALNVVAIACAIPRYFSASDSSGVLLVNVVWACLNSLMIGACIAVSFENKQRRSTIRIEAALAARLCFPEEPERHCQVIDFSEGGIALRGEQPFQNEANTAGIVHVRAGLDEFQFRVQTVRTSDNRIHLRFKDSDIQHQRQITKLVYARADSWIDWAKDQKRDRILSSLMHVFRIGAQGIWILPSLLMRSGKKKGPKRTTGKLALSKATLPLLLCAIGLSCAISAQAQSDSSNFQDHQSFSDLGARSALVLSPAHPKQHLAFIVPSTKIVDQANLALALHAADWALADDSELAVSLNNVEVAALGVHDFSAGSKPVRIALPSDLLVHDNAFDFELRQKCTTPCDPAKAKDRTGSARIESVSEIETSGFVMTMPNRLSSLPAPFFDPSLQHAQQLPVILDREPDFATLKAAGVMASWYGALASYRGSHFQPVFGHFPKGNAILLALSQSPLAAAVHLEASAPQIAICDNPSDRYGKVLAIIAPDGQTLVRLASLLAHNRFQPEGERFAPAPAQLENASETAPAKPMWADARYPIQLTHNMTDAMLHARIGAPGKVYFRLTPDLEYGNQITVPLRLVFRLSGLTADDHIWLTLRLNNTFITKRRLSSADTNHTVDQSFAIPASLLFASNTLELGLATDRLETTVLDPRSVDLQILEHSQLELGDPVHFVQMPRLDLFASSGYPFTAKPGLSETTVVLPEFPTCPQIGLYLDAIGFLSAQTSVPADRFTVVKPRDVRTGRDSNFLIIASTNDDEPLRAFERSMMILPAEGHFAIGQTTLPAREWLSRAWLGRGDELRRLNQLMENEASIKFVLEQFVSPFRADRSAVVLATRSDDDEHAYFDRLTVASRDGAIAGGLAIADSDHFVSFQLTSKSYALGSAWSLGGIYCWLRFHLWILPLGLLVAAFLVAFWWEQLLQRQLERRLQAAV